MERKDRQKKIGTWLVIGLFTIVFGGNLYILSTIQAHRLVVEIAPGTYKFRVYLSKKGDLGTVVDDVDHRHLNIEVAWLAGINPTSENLVRVFFDRIEPELPELEPVRGRALPPTDSFGR